MSFNMSRRRFCEGLGMVAAVDLIARPAPAQVVGTTVAMTQTNVPATVMGFTTSGYAVNGDGGAAIFSRAGTSYDSRLRLTTADGSYWFITNSRLRPEMFGAKADGVTDSTQGLGLCLLTGKPIDLLPGTYVTTSQLYFDWSTNPTTATLEIAGSGMGQTTILIADYTCGIWLQGNTTTGSSFYLHDFSIGRTNANAYTGAIGQHTIAVLNGGNVVISNVEEYGAIGMGILLSACQQFVIAGCNVHDHKGGSAHLSGTDGIHVDASVGPGQIYNNTVSNVGDDAISHGSYSPTITTSNISTYNNDIQNTSGPIKVWGNAANINIYNNTVRSAANGGVTLWDDRNVGTSFNITNISITGNTITSCGGPGASGGIYLGQTAGNGTQQFSNITINGNHISNCQYGISVLSVISTKRTSNLTITNNVISGSKYHGLFMNTIATALNISSNTILNSGWDGIYFGSMYPGTYSITSNVISGICALFNDGRAGGMSIQTYDVGTFTITGNTISDIIGRTTNFWGIYVMEQLSAKTLLSTNTIDLTTTKGVNSQLP